ncbi:MAG: DUF4124 domain-containing protein [Steroidobacteraceae bacterium]|jgi:hypothetical protein|nr:DUF4124 domain-containing protein [Steroidobacteraceae bacterium]
MRLLFAVALVFALVPLTAQADVYRWVDATGQEHYSDLPVEGAELIRTTTPRPPSAGGTPPRAAATPGPAMISAAGDAQATRDAERAVARDLAAQRAKDCTEAKARYEKSLQARRIFRTLENGEREFLSDAEADKVRVANRATMETACGQSTASR